LIPFAFGVLSARPLASFSPLPFFLVRGDVVPSCGKRGEAAVPESDRLWRVSSSFQFGGHPFSPLPFPFSPLLLSCPDGRPLDLIGWQLLAGGERTLQVSAPGQLLPSFLKMLPPSKLPFSWYCQFPFFFFFRDPPRKFLERKKVMRV